MHSVQRNLWGEAKTGTPTVLNDYELKMYTNFIFYIEKKLGERVSGKVYELTPEQLAATDKYETEAYKRVTVVDTDPDSPFTSYQVYVKQ